jgi:hypothetical protein
MLSHNSRNMKTQADRKYSYLPLLIAGIAVVLFSTAAIARMMGWGLSSTDDSGDIPALEVSARSEGGARPRCPECGMIVSTGNHEIIVRMADGSSRVIDDANPARWRAGERLIVIAGTDPSLP